MKTIFLVCQCIGSYEGYDPKADSTVAFASREAADRYCSRLNATFGNSSEVFEIDFEDQ